MSLPASRAGFTPSLRLLLVGMLLSSVGSGLTMSLLVIYLSGVRGIATVVAGLVLSWVAVVSLVLGPVGGTLIDRFGARTMLGVALAVEGVGVGLYALVTTTAAAFAVATVTAIGGSLIWSAQSTLLAQLTAEESRQRVFGVQFMLLNLGLGIGGLVAASIVDLADPSTFVRLYMVDAASYFAFLVVLPLVRLPRRTAAQIAADSEAEGGYREVIADRSLRRLVVAYLVMLTFGYGSLEAGVPLYLTRVAGMPVRDIGIVFAVNTGVIVVAQWWTIRFSEGRSRVSLLATVGVLWGVSWAVMGGSALLAGTVALVALCAGMAIFALAETVWSPVAPALVNHLAPDHLRGRYNAVSAWGYSVGGAVGPALAGALIGASLGGAWIVIVVVGSFAGALLALSLRPLLTNAEDGRTGEPDVVRGSLS